MLPLFFLASALGALTIDLKRGIEEGSPFAILHIREKEPFVCSIKKDDISQPPYYLCSFGKMPDHKPENISSDFFKISFGIENGRFLCRITPLKKSELSALPPPVYEDGILPPKKIDRSAHWMILGYENDPPYLKRKQHFEDSINFPIDLRDYAIPTIGAVDINGDPVFMKSNRDVERFMAVKRAFDSRKYKRAYELATEAQEEFPDSIFGSDFLRYRIKALAKEDMKEHADQIIKLGKTFIKRYTSDEYLPEVLLILARVYSATGFESDANYFFDRLISEHKGSRFANLGMIYLGDQLYINGKPKEAIKRYLEAYYSAKDLDVASLAAYKLAIRYLDRGKVEDAVSYLKKIWDKNPQFILKDKDDAHRIATQLAANKVYDLAIEIDRAILKRLKKLDDLYEKILFEIAQMYDEKGDIKNAIEWYERYLDEFAYGEFSDDAKKSLDELFVADSDTNVTRALEKFDTLIDEYSGENIAFKALAAKLKILLSQKRYKEVLQLAAEVEQIEDPQIKSTAESAIRDAAFGVFEEAAKEGDCKNGVEMVEEYSIEPDEKYDDFLYGCYMKYARYDEALKIARRHIQDPAMSKRIEWLCKTVHLLTLSQRYQEAFKAASELEALGTNSEHDRCSTLDWDLVAIFHANGRYSDEISLIKKMSRKYSDKMRMAEVFRMGYDAAKENGDRLQQKWMLKSLVELQNRLKSHPYSPWAEFELIRILRKEGKFEEALKYAEEMKSLELRGKTRARWLYELASLYESLGRNKRAETSFRECAEIDDGGAWSGLCKDALPIE